MASATLHRFPRHRGVAARGRILTTLRERHTAGLRPPTVRELADAIGLGTTATREHLAWLEGEGLIRRHPGSRGIQLVSEQDTTQQAQP